MDPTTPNAANRPDPSDLDDRRPDALGPMLSAAIFGYFGFFTGLSSDDGAGNIVPLYITTVWVLRIGAVLFAVAAMFALSGMREAGLFAGVAGAIATLGLAAVTAWSMIDPQHDIAVNHLIMIICIVWNAYSSFVSIRAGLR